MKCPWCKETSCRQCHICMEWECSHHEFEPIERPESCVCNPHGWGSAVIPEVCDEHKGDLTKNCEQCEHDSECHVRSD